jgi:hypothetical protein
MASMSGFFVPPTWVNDGCSQNRVHATGSIPQASSVSVIEGTSEITLTTGQDAMASRETAPMTERLEVQRAIAADAAAIFRVVSDPKGHVAIDASGMLMDATGAPATKVGDSFVIHMDREALNDYPLGLYDVTVTIVTFEQDREIAWTPGGQLNLGHVYGYRLEPIDGGTLVTQYYDWSGIEQQWKDAAIFPVVPELALRATLGILARTVAPGKPRPGA